MSDLQTPPARRAERGFTLMEMAVTLFVLVIVIAGVLKLFDLAARISRVQVDTADMQESVRTAQYDLVRMLRMAGRGKVPAESPTPAAGPWTWSIPNGIAVAVQNNVPANTTVDAPGTAFPVLQGTDILTIRGVLTSPVYLVTKGSFVVNSTNPLSGANGGSFSVANVTEQGSLPQALEPLADAIQQGRPEALILVSPDDDSIRQIVRLDPAGSSVTVVGGVTTSVNVAFKIGGDPYAIAYWGLSGDQWNPGLTTKLGYVGIVEEYRYYVGDERESGASSPPKPRLLRARTYPGTAQPWGQGPGGAINNVANWNVPMADNVADLQVALGIETGVGDAFSITDTGDDADEWLFNSTADNAALPSWASGRLRYVRLSTTSYSDRRDQSYQAPGYDAPQPPPHPPVSQVGAEDHLYFVPEYGTANAIVPDRMYRRRTLQTIIDLRNL